MLTPTIAEGLSPEDQNGTYRCWAASYPLHDTSVVLLGFHGVASPCLALRWLRERTRHITDQLDAPYAQPGRHWLTDEAEQERALTYLATGTAYQLTLHDESTRYFLVIYPPGGTA